MAKEKEIRKKAIEILEKEKWLVWHSPKVKYFPSDIFGAFDLICWKKKRGNLKLIQVTTLANLSVRRKKIKKFLKKNEINSKSVGIELWAWNRKKRIFKIETI